MSAPDVLARAQAAAEAHGSDPQRPAAARITAALALVQAGGFTHKDAAYRCGVGHANQLAPSQWAKSGVSPEMVNATVQAFANSSPNAQRAPSVRAEPLRAGLSRFGHAKIEVERTVGLRADHPALAEGRTIFPGSVVGTLASPRFLVSGHNNPKLGKRVLKGERQGWPIYHLTLEERATCPRSCAQWAACYGNAMPYARRHRPDAAFLENLRAELQNLQFAHPSGFLVRLHTLGDFYSAEYVLFWAKSLSEFPALHAFRYTARRIDDEDPASAKIARAIAVMTRAMWGRFAIRTSHNEAGPERSIVVTEPPTDADVILCPSQTDKTAACATCGLCWVDGARPKTIAFLKHGMKRRGPIPREGDPDPERDPPDRAAPAVEPGKLVEVTMTASARRLGKPPLAELPQIAPRRPLSRATPSAPIQAPKATPPMFRMKSITPNILRWSSAYLARGGVTVDYLADLFTVDADDLAHQLSAAERRRVA